MTNDEIFNNITKKYGGKLDIGRTEYFDSLMVRYSSFLNGYNKYDDFLKPFPTIIFDFIDNPSFNAMAGKQDNIYVIGIYQGVYEILKDIFTLMLSNPEILKQVGDSSKEILQPKIPDYYKNIEEVLLDESLKPKLPNDLFRRKYVDYLTVIGVDFIFEHELAHIIFGHVDYINKHENLNTFFEFNENKVSPSDNLNRQTLEMDADSRSLGRLCRHAWIAIDHAKNNHDEVFKYIYKDYYSSFSTYSFVLSTIFLIFGDKNFKNLHPGFSSHPPSHIREFMINSTYAEVLSKNNLNLDLKLLTKKIMDAMLHAIEAYEIVTMKKVNIEKYTPKYFGSNLLSPAIIENWKKNLKNSLSPFAFRPLAD